MATHATLWLDMRDQFAKEHLTEWEAQKSQACSLNDLECDTEVIYRARLIKRQDDKDIANSREAASKQLPPEQQAAHAERQARAMRTNLDAAPVRSQAALYPNWVQAWVTKPQGSDPAQTVQNTQAGRRPRLFIGGGVGHQFCIRPTGTGVSIKPTIGLPAQLFTVYYHKCGRT